jgi:amino acid transporter
MKNKQDIFVGIITIIATLGAMIFSLNYTSKALAENAKKNTVPIIINKKDKDQHG